MNFNFMLYLSWLLVLHAAASRLISAVTDASTRAVASSAMTRTTSTNINTSTSGSVEVSTPEQPSDTASIGGWTDYGISNQLRASPTNANMATSITSTTDVGSSSLASDISRNSRHAASTIHAADTTSSDMPTVATSTSGAGASKRNAVKTNSSCWSSDTLKDLYNDFCANTPSCYSGCEELEVRHAKLCAYLFPNDRQPSNPSSASASTPNNTSSAGASFPAQYTASSSASWSVSPVSNSAKARLRGDVKEAARVHLDETRRASGSTSSLKTFEKLRKPAATPDF